MDASDLLSSAPSPVADAVAAVHLSPGEATLRLVVALALGGVIGVERDRAGHDAGVRTHAMLALGTALFGVISVGGFAAFAADSSDTNVLVDVTRVASYVAAAVGFLGAGVIVKGRHGVRGLTTATSIWTTCAIGLACGLGLLAIAAIATGLALATLVLDHPIERLRAWRSGRPRPTDD